MKRRTSIALAIVAVAALAGCSSSKAPAVAAVVVTPTPTIPMQASPTATPYIDPGDAILKLGKPGHNGGSLIVATVYAYKQPTATGSPSPRTKGFVWGAIDVKVCVSIAATINYLPWTLAYADDGQIEPSNLGYNGFPSPGFPFGDKAMNAGRCIRGWIVFPVPKTKRPIMVEYTDDDGTVLDWKV